MPQNSPKPAEQLPRPHFNNMSRRDVPIEFVSEDEESSSSSDEYEIEVIIGGESVLQMDLDNFNSNGIPPENEPGTSTDQDESEADSTSPSDNNASPSYEPVPPTYVRYTGSSDEDESQSEGTFNPPVCQPLVNAQGDAVDMFVERISFDDNEQGACVATFSPDVSSDEGPLSPTENADDKSNTDGVMINEQRSAECGYAGAEVIGCDSVPSSSKQSSDRRCDSCSLNQCSMGENSSYESNQYVKKTGDSESTLPKNNSSRTDQCSDNSVFNSNNFQPSQSALNENNRSGPDPTWTAQLAEEELKRVYLNLIATIRKAIQFSPSTSKCAGTRQKTAQQMTTTARDSKETSESSGSGTSSTTSSSSDQSSPDNNGIIAQDLSISKIIPQTNRGVSSLSRASKALSFISKAKRARSSSSSEDSSSSKRVSSSDSEEQSDISAELRALDHVALEHRAMMLHFSELIIREFERDGPVRLEKVTDYEMCFAVMQSEYARFSDKLNRLLSVHGKLPRLSRMCRLRDDNVHYIARIKYGIILLNCYRGFQSTPGNTAILSSLEQFEKEVRGEEWKER